MDLNHSKLCVFSTRALILARRSLALFRACRRFNRFISMSTPAVIGLCQLCQERKKCLFTNSVDVASVILRDVSRMALLSYIPRSKVTTFIREPRKLPVVLSPEEEA